MSDDLKQWSKLLQAIAKGVVIPIIGRDLLRIEIDGRDQLLYEYLAAQLTAQLEVECEPSSSVDQLVAAYLNASRRNSRDDVNLKAFEILNQSVMPKVRSPCPNRSASSALWSLCGSSSVRPWIHSLPMRSARPSITFLLTHRIPPS